MLKKGLLILLITGSIFIAGCWNRRELDHLAIVMGSGIDLGKDGEIVITAQIVKPSAIKEGGGGEGSGGQAPALVLSSQGKTVFDAVRNFVSTSSRKLFWSHNEIFIFGEEFAKAGVGRVIDWVERDAETRREVGVLVAKGEASEILSIPGDLEKLSALEISQALQAAGALSKAIRVDLNQFMLQYVSESTAPVAPRIELVKEGNQKKFRIVGMAVFKKDKLVGWLNERETRGLLWVLGEVKSGILVIGGPSPPKGKISIEIIKAKSKVKGEFIGGKPLITVDIEENGNIGEVTTPMDIAPPEKIKAIEKSQEELIKGEVVAALQKAQKLKVDIFGFGEELHRVEPKEWAKIKNRWEEEFSQLEVKIAVKARVRALGEKTIPSKPK